MQLMGIPPSAVSTCSLALIQEVVWPLALRLVPIHRRPSAGPPASAEGSSSVAVPAGLAPSPAPLPCGAACPLAPPLRLRCLRLRRRLTSPPLQSPSHNPRDVLHQMAIHRPRNQRQPCRRLARRLSANSEKARENVASHRKPAGTAPSRTAHSLPSTSRRSIRPRVVGTSNTSLGYEGARHRRAVLDPDALPGRGSRAEEPRPAPVPEPQTKSSQRSPIAAELAIIAPASGTTLVERRTSNPIAISRRDLTGSTPPWS